MSSCTIHLDDLIQICKQSQWMVLPEPGNAVMEQVLVSFTIPDITQVSYQLQCVQGIFFPCLHNMLPPEWTLPNQHVPVSACCSLCAAQFWL